MSEPLPAAHNAEQIGDLIVLIQRGNEAALRRLYSLAGPKLFAVALRIVRRRSLAEDVLQEAFVRIWRSCHDYTESKGSAWAWMITIVRNRAIDCIRRDREVLVDPEEGIWEQVDPAEGPLQSLLRSEQASRIKKCLDQLSKEQRQAILVAYYEGHTHEDIAKQSGTPLGTVKTWIRRGLLRVKECLQS